LKWVEDERKALNSKKERERAYEEYLLQQQQQQQPSPSPSVLGQHSGGKKGPRIFVSEIIHQIYR
jgi:hypothetical protein